ncbi:MAG: HPr family phosphocarrier protein [Thermoanaerobaculia bacterium]
MELEERFEIRNKYGLHARASTRVAQVAQRFRSDIWISRAEGAQEVDGKSILGILTLGAERGMLIRVRVRGDDAGEAMKALSRLISENFNEE